MTLRSSASRGGKSGTHLVTVAGQQVGVDDRVEQVRPVYRTGRGSGPGGQAFLLRRTDELFLKTNEDVNRRLEHLHSRLEGDARYPVNGIYCYATAWQHALARLAPKSDAVLMDLRDFTRKNQGCAFELTWVVQQIPLSRIILLVDATSDYQALEEVAQSAWAHLRSDSPNAGYVEPVLMTLNAPRRPRDMGRTLFMLLLRAAYHVKV